MESKVPYTVPELEAALMRQKKAGNYKGKTTGLKKAQLINILKETTMKDSSGNVIKFQFSSIPSYKRVSSKYQKPQTRVKKPYGPLNRAEMVKKPVGRPRKTPIGPKLPKGMTYTRLAKKFAKEGNPQLEQEIANPTRGPLPPIPPLKKRGRPRKTTTTLPVPAQVVAGQRKARKQRSDKGKKRGPRA